MSEILLYEILVTEKILATEFLPSFLSMRKMSLMKNKLVSKWNKFNQKVQEKTRKVKRTLDFYNRDAIIAVGYRVKDVDVI